MSRSWDAGIDETVDAPLGRGEIEYMVGIEVDDVPLGRGIIGCGLQITTAGCKGCEILHASVIGSFDSELWTSSCSWKCVFPQNHLRSDGTGAEATAKRIDAELKAGSAGHAEIELEVWSWDAHGVMVGTAVGEDDVGEDDVGEDDVTEISITKATGVRIWGDAHGHGPCPITNSERTLLSAWLKQGRDWLML
jgi:hypothetical protein